MGTKKGQRRKTARRAYYKPSRKRVSARGGKRSPSGSKQITVGGELFTYFPSAYNDERYIGAKAAELRQRGFSVRTRKFGEGLFAIFKK